MTTTEFDRRAAIARGAIRADFGEGWMTTGARDMVRIAAFAGFDIPELVQRVALATKHDGMTGPRLVERVMAEMDAEFPAMTTTAATTELNAALDALGTADQRRDAVHVLRTQALDAMRRSVR